MGGVVVDGGAADDVGGVRGRCDGAGGAAAGFHDEVEDEGGELGSLGLGGVEGGEGELDGFEVVGSGWAFGGGGALILGGGVEGEREAAWAGGGLSAEGPVGAEGVVLEGAAGEGDGVFGPAAQADEGDEWPAEEDEGECGGEGEEEESFGERGRLFGVFADGAGRVEGVAALWAGASCDAFDGVVAGGAAWRGGSEGRIEGEEEGGGGESEEEKDGGPGECGLEGLEEFHGEAAGVLVGDFLDGVSVPGGDADDDGAFFADLALAGEAAVSLEAGCFFDAVVLGLGGLGEEVHSFFDVDVAGGAGADAAAGVLDVDAGGECDFEEVLCFGGHDDGFGVVESEGVVVLGDESDGDVGWELVGVDGSDVHVGGSLCVAWRVGPSPPSKA